MSKFIIKCDLKDCGASNSLQSAIWMAGIVARNNPGARVFAIDTSLPYDSEVEKTVYIMGKGRVNYRQTLVRKQKILETYTLLSLQRMAQIYGYPKDPFKARKKTLTKFLLPALMNEYMKL